MLVMQNGKTLFEHYANGGGAEMRCKIFSGTKSFWGMAALCAARDGLIRLDDRVADTITEWKNDPRKSQITIRQLLNQTDGIEPAPHLHGQALSGSGANPSYGLTLWLNRQAPNAREIDYEKELDLKWQRAHWLGICICRAAPPDMVVALGSNYQRLFIIPSMNALIVRQGMSAKFSDAYFLRLVLGR